MSGAWWTRTWNPVSGCSSVSEGCCNCWARRMAGRLAGRCGYPPAVNTIGRRCPGGPGFAPTFHANRLDEPLRRRRPEVYFACGMGDLFHEDMRTEWIDAVLAVMALSARHTFMVATKRPRRMAEHLNQRDAAGWRDHLGQVAWGRWGEDAECAAANAIEGCLATGHNVGWPMRNLWAGTSVEDQATADERVPRLLLTAAAHRFVSYEPALGPADFRQINGVTAADVADSVLYFPLVREVTFEGRNEPVRTPSIGLDLVVAGGETGPGARPAHPDWFRLVRDQCAAAGAGFHLKQFGEWIVGSDDKLIHHGRVWDSDCDDCCWLGFDGEVRHGSSHGMHANTFGMIRVGHKAAGRLLDGVEHNAGPHTEVGRG